MEEAKCHVGKSAPTNERIVITNVSLCCAFSSKFPIMAKPLPPQMSVTVVRNLLYARTLWDVSLDREKS
jgi:hypothetical protein